MTALIIVFYSAVLILVTVGIVFLAIGNKNDKHISEIYRDSINRDIETMKWLRSEIKLRKNAAELSKINVNMHNTLVTAMDLIKQDVISISEDKDKEDIERITKFIDEIVTSHKENIKKLEEITETHLNDCESDMETCNKNIDMLEDLKTKYKK